MERKDNIKQKVGTDTFVCPYFFDVIFLDVDLVVNELTYISP